MCHGGSVQFSELRVACRTLGAAVQVVRSDQDTGDLRFGVLFDKMLASSTDEIDHPLKTNQRQCPFPCVFCSFLEA